jgi:hypothetical protein
MPANKEVFWRSIITRLDRDLERMWQSSEAGDLLCDKFFFYALGLWLEKCRKPVDEAPRCLACEHAFCDYAQPPLTYLITYSEDPRIQLDLLVMTGICQRCAKKNDAELLKLGAELTAKRLDGRALGFDGPSTRTAQ